MASGKTWHREGRSQLHLGNNEKFSLVATTWGPKGTGPHEGEMGQERQPGPACSSPANLGP